MERRSTRQRLGRRAGSLLLVAGGIVIAFPFWSALYTHYEQDRLGSAYRRADAAFATKTRHQPPAGHQSAAAEARSLAALFARGLRPGDPIGRLQISRLHLDVLVVQGSLGVSSLNPASDASYLRGGPVHYGITPLPGAGTPVAIAGHRTTYSAPFYGLGQLRAGNWIVLDTPYGRFAYRVVTVMTVRPSDVGVLFDRRFDLVLTTCTPPYSASHRLVVAARLVNFQLRR
jgi:sortase A